jgi:DNA-binding transcriptional regulator YiaG
MLQREVAEHLGVDETSVHNWEVNVSSPRIEHMPAVIRFIGYNPLPEAKSLAEQLVRQRTTLGFSRKEAAVEIRVDPSTLALWELGEKEPTGEFLNRVTCFLDGQEAQSMDSRRAG